MRVALRYVYSIFILCLSYIYGIFIVCLWYVVGRKRVWSREQGVWSRVQGVVEKNGVYVFVGILDVLDVLGRCATIDN